MQITNPQIIELRDALVNALSLDEMDDSVLKLGEDRETITLPKNKAEMFRKVVEFYNRYNRVDALLTVTRAVNPTNPALFRFAQQVGLATEFPTEAANDAGLEKIIRAYLPTLNLRQWLTDAATTENRICLVGTTGGPLGTGFLVGPGAVMTNYHVAEQFITGQDDPARLRFTFDFALLAGGGTVFEPLLPDWLIDYSELASSDLTSLTAPPVVPANRLDYAVLRVAGRPGDQVVGGGATPDGRGAPRGWFTLPTQPHDFAAHKALLLLHHAAGRPLQLSIDTDSYLTANPGNTRVWHRSNTEAGSSGSPCFDLEWKPVALHQGFNVIGGQRANRAAPLKAVQRLLEERGKLAELEA